MLYILNLLITFIIFLLSSFEVHAVCPVCTIAVGAGLGFSRWIGIDDTVTGVWIGGLIISSGLWMADWIKKKNWKVPYLKVLSIFVMYLFVIPPLYWSHMIGIINNTLWGIDKLLFGIMVGSIIFLIGVGFDKWLRTTNKGKVYVYFQKVIVPVFLLVITSLFFYFITS